MGKPATTAVAREAWLHVVRLFTSEENQRRFLEIAAGLQLTPAALRALLSLLPETSKTMRALAEEWHCDPSNVTAIVDQLEQGDLVERRVGTTDRRVKTVTLTAAGGKAREEAMELLSLPHPGLDRLSPAEQRSLRDLLRKATAGLPPLR